MMVTQVLCLHLYNYEANIVYLKSVVFAEEYFVPLRLKTMTVFEMSTHDSAVLLT